MFRTIAAKHRRDRDLPERAWMIGVLRSVIEGTFYDVLPHEFHEEHDGQEYVPIRDRAPSVRYNLCRTTVEDAAGLVFGEERFPRITADDETITEALNDLATATSLPHVMTEAAIAGSVGSVAILMRVLKSQIFWSVMGTEYLTPVWKADAPTTLAKVIELYKVKGAVLKAQGYDAEPGRNYWFQRIWDEKAETWFLPWPVSPTREEAAAQPEPKVDDKRTVQHDLGFVPIVWVKNLPGPSATGDAADGASTFKAAIDTQIELEYQLSQAGRGLKYSSEPTLLIKEPANPNGEFVKNGANALIVSEKGDAKMLEIGGTAAEAVIGYVKFLRELALEQIHGNRADPQRLSAGQSGRALEIMNYGLVGLAGQLRTSYGNSGMIKLLNMALRASGKAKIQCRGKAFPAVAEDVNLSLVWPDWWPASPEERHAEAQALQLTVQAGVLSQESAVGIVADSYDIEDPKAELARIKAERKAEDERAAQQAAQVKATETLPS